MQKYKIQKELEVFLEILNQVFEIEKKIDKIDTPNSISRNVNRIKEMFETSLQLIDNSGFFLENPVGQSYDESRIDLDANISGEGINDLVVIEVIKPIIRFKQGGFNQLVQKGIVIVESKND